MDMIKKGSKNWGDFFYNNKKLSINLKNLIKKIFVLYKNKILRTLVNNISIFLFFIQLIIIYIYT